MAEDKWFNSGRGIFCRDAGFQLATMPIVPNWQEDAARIVDLLNKGERYDALHQALTSTAEVPCYGQLRTKLRCFPNDMCSSCRARAVLSSTEPKSGA
jgi:hypothetical protein